GGSLAYQGGNVISTMLQGADGKLYSADDAPSNIEMVSVGRSFVVNHDRWGQAYLETYADPFSRAEVVHYENGYIVGKDGGQLILAAPTSLFSGTIQADVTPSTLQTQARPAGVTDSYLLPQTVAPLAGGLVLAQYNQLGLSDEVASDVRFGSNVP